MSPGHPVPTSLDLNRVAIVRKLAKQSLVSKEYLQRVEKEVKEVKGVKEVEEVEEVQKTRKSRGNRR